MTFNRELYAWIYTVDMIQEKLFVGLLLNDPSVIHKPVPIPGGERQTRVLLPQNAPCTNWLLWGLLATP